MKKEKVQLPFGRPTEYKPEFCELVRRMGYLGMTNEDWAKAFNVNVTTIDLWLTRYPDFSGAVKEMREGIDSDVGSSLYKRAMGFEYKFIENGIEVVKYFPPDPTAMIFWLKNRQRLKWRDKHEIEQTITVNPSEALAELQAAADAAKRK